MAQKLETGPLQIQHGHTGTHVLVQFSRVADHVLLTEPQAEAFLTAVANSLKMLREHKAKGAANG